MIETDKIELIKNIAQDNILEVISDFVELKKRGVTYVGLSPFSNERTPSFTVHPAKGIFKCFSSGNGGDCIKFLMLTQHCKFIEAVKYLALKYKIYINDDSIINYSYQKRELQPVTIHPDYIHPDYMISTWSNYENNNLYKFLITRFTHDQVITAFKAYHIGIDNKNPDYIIFWQVDINTYVRSGKYIKYKIDGHRDKDSKTFWEHTKTKDYKPVYPDFILGQCFFGEHLVNESNKPIAVVESEKTAIIASLLQPKYIWLACGSKNGLNDIKCAVLVNRSVTLYPDLGAFDEWDIQAKKYNFNISDILEKRATDDQRLKGLDLADYLLL